MQETRTSSRSVDVDAVAARLGLKAATVKDLVANLKMPSEPEAARTPEYISIDEASARLGLKVETVVDLIVTGRLAAIVDDRATEANNDEIEGK